jgi:hypothetical protein
MARRFFVPLVFVHIDPKPNANIPAIEKTRRSVTAPTYALPLYKAKWGPAAKISTGPLLPTQNPYHEIIVRDEEGVDMDPDVDRAADMEIARLMRHFNTAKKDVFHQVFTDELFRERFKAVAKMSNPWLDAVEEASAKADEAATDVAAEKLVEAAAKVQATKAAKVARQQQEHGSMQRAIAKDAQQREVEEAAREALEEAEAAGDMEGDTSETAGEAAGAETDELPAAEPVIPRRGPGRPKREKAPVGA